MPPNPIKQSVLRRVKWLYIFFVCLTVAVIAKIVWLQVGVQSGELKEQSLQYSFRSEILEASRGDILSDDQRSLATSIVYYELRMDMMATGLTDTLFNNNVGALALKLSEFFKDKSADQYQADLVQARSEKMRYYRLSPRKVDYLELEKILKFPLLGLGTNKGGFIPMQVGRRENPYGQLALRTIGFVNKNGVKVGIEGAFDDDLRGTNGLTVKQKISGNFWIPVSSPLNIEPINGVDVVTTLNIEMQDIVQREIRQRLAEVEADWGTAVLMEVATGHIKAIANYTRKRSGEIVEDYNYAIGMSLEPGSTFKLAGLLALLDDAKAPLSQNFDTEAGEVQLGYVKVVDSRSGGYGVLSLQGVFEHSSNIGMAKAVNKYYANEPARFVEYMSKLGLHKELGLQIAGEAKPLIKHPSLKNGWDGTTLTMMSYGYALRMAPIQTLALYNAVANGGHMICPIFVSQTRQYGNVVDSFTADTIVANICSPQTLSQVQRSLEGVVERGTGKMLGNENYSVAAKTGTAQIAIGRSGYTAVGGGRHYLGSVAGYFPASKPRYSLIVAFKTFHREGSDKPYYGGALAGPSFRTIADQIYQNDYRLHPTLVAPVITTPARLTASAGSAEELNSLMAKLKIHSPRATGAMAVIDSGEVRAFVPVADSLAPSVRGMSLREAVPLLEKQGFRVQIQGRGTIVGQNYKTDSLSKTTIVELILK